MSKEIDITGKKFNRWVALKFSHKDKNNKHYWLCQCECGTIKTVEKQSLIRGISHSCGCYNLEQIIKRNTKHSLSKTRLDNTYTAMKSRCYNSNDKSYKYYGGRGIKICKEWLDNRKSFFEWALKNGYQDDLTIDRINVNGNYEPSNCRWVTMKKQCQNKNNNRNICYKGETHTLAEWSTLKGIKYFTLRSRLDNYGWSIEKALETEVKR